MFHIPIATAYGPRLAASPSRVAIPSEASAALAFAAYHDRRADLLLSEGRVVQAEAAAHLALEARCRALGVRA